VSANHFSCELETLESKFTRVEGCGTKPLDIEWLHTRERCPHVGDVGLNLYRISVY